MTPLEFFRVVAKQFASVPDDDVNAWLSITDLTANTACLMGDRRNLALALYAAHLMSLDLANQSGEGGRGDIKSEREGDLSRSYGTAVNDGQWLGQSPYGQQYANMLLACVGATIMTRFGDSPPGVVAPYADDVYVGGQPRNLY